MKVILKNSVLLLLLLATLSSAQQQATPQRPNIILIMADDMGFSDIGCYGSEVPTPNLDRLAANGLKLRSFYNAGRCCPTRTSLLTGQYPHAAGMGLMVTFYDQKIVPGPYQGFLDPKIPTVAEHLRKAGYHTYMTGKWHVGERQEHWPLKRGFEQYFGLISGASSFFEMLPEKRKRYMVSQDQEYVLPKDGFYATDAFTDKAIEFIQGQAPQSKPFFLYLAYTAPHFPLHAYESDIAKYEQLYLQGWDVIRQQRFQNMQKLGLLDSRYVLSQRPADIPTWSSVSDKKDWARKMAVYAAMIDRMDQNIGKLIRTLEARKELDNTLIVFLSDNGGTSENVDDRKLGEPGKRIGERGSYATYDAPWANVSNTPFKRYKRFMHEGGIISPCIMHWPAKVKARQGFQDAPAHVIDLLPTCLELAKVKIPADLPGQSLSQFWKGKKSQTRSLYWEHEGNKALRKNNWKLVKEHEDSAWELYDLAADPAESRDLAPQSPQKVQELQADYAAWAKKIGVREILPKK